MLDISEMSLESYHIEFLLSAVPQADNKSRLLVIAAVFTIAYASVCSLQYILNSGHRKFWNSHAWAGVKHYAFPRTRAGLEAIRRTREIVEEGFEKVRSSRCT